MFGGRLKGLAGKLRKAIGLEEEEANSDAADLPVDADPTADRVPDGQSELFPFYQTVERLKGYFPGTDIVADPGTLPIKVGQLVGTVATLAGEYELSKQVYDAARALARLDRDLEQLAPRADELARGNMALQQQAEELEMWLSGNAGVPDMKAAEAALVHVQGRFQAKIAEAETARTKIEGLKAKLDQGRDQDEELKLELDEERERHAQLLRELQSFQAESQHTRRASQDELPIAQLEQKVAAEAAELQKILSERFGNGDISDLEHELAQLNERYKAIVDSRETPSEREPESSDRRSHDNAAQSLQRRQGRRQQTQAFLRMVGQRHYSRRPAQEGAARVAVERRSDLH
jgi:chromosome segregation ATPase